MGLKIASYRSIVESPIAVRLSPSGQRGFHTRTPTCSAVTVPEQLLPPLGFDPVP